MAAAGLDVTLLAPVTDHATSDAAGVAILGAEADDFWRDHKGAKVNAIRTRTQIERADVVVVRFGDEYRQGNAAFDAGYAAALGTPVITLPRPALGHALKEVDAAALAVAETPRGKSSACSPTSSRKVVDCHQLPLLVVTAVWSKFRHTVDAGCPPDARSAPP